MCLYKLNWTGRSLYFGEKSEILMSLLIGDRTEKRAEHCICIVQCAAVKPDARSRIKCRNQLKFENSSLINIIPGVPLKMMIMTIAIVIIYKIIATCYLYTYLLFVCQ